MPVDILEKKELKLVGFSVRESLNNVLKNSIVGKLREELVNRKNEVINRKGEGIYLIQLYPDCPDGQWTHDTQNENIVATEVTSFSDIPSGMIKHLIPAGRYAKFVHNGPESEISNTYQLINEYSLRPFDIEYWHNIFTLESSDNQIDIYIPVK